MKKLFTLLTMLVLGIGSSWGQVTNRASAGNPITYADYVASAGNGEKYAFQMPSTNSATYTKWCGLQSSVGNHTNLRVDQLFILEKSSTSGKYWLKRYSNSEYLAGTGDNCFSSTPLDLTLNNRLPDDKSNEYNDQDLHISFDNASGAHFNGGNGNYNFTGGPGSSSGNGGWTTYIAYGPFYIVTFKCKVNGELIYTESVIAKTGDVLDVPDLPGYTAPSPSKYKVGSEDASPEITYTASSYPVNFKREQTFTRSDRHINSVTFSFVGAEQTQIVNNVYENTSTKCYQDLTSSKIVKVPTGTSVTPQFNIAGVWQHGFVYIDLNDDGDFTDDGELVSKINEGNPGSNFSLPQFTTPDIHGTHRMRIKTDWSSTDPGGNTGDEEPHTISSSNHIIANGGMIVDVNLVITPAAGFYRVKNVATNGYLYATAASDYTSTDRYVYANGSNSGAETIVQLVEHEGHLYMLNQGHEFGWVAESSTGSGQVGYVRANNFDKYVNWLPGTAAGQIAFAICYGNGTGDDASYLTQGIYAVDTNDNAVIRGTEGYTANTAQWVFEPATGFDVAMNGTVDGNHYATLCVPFDVTISNATAYTLAKSESGNYLVPTAVEDNKVPAGTPVLLKGKSASATATINTGDAFHSGSPLDCALTGTYVAKTIDGSNDYVLGKKDGKVGFYHWSSNNLAANRAYLAGSSNNARGFALMFDDDATGIVSTPGETEEGTVIYNLSGQRLNKIQKGINIVNGKKVLF
jgi:hypothetical protein